MPNIVYTVAEKIEMVRQHEQGLSFRRIVDHFAAAYPERPIPSKSTVLKIVRKFQETGNLDPSLVKISQPRKRLSEEIKLAICLAAAEGLSKPHSQIAKELNISTSSVHKVLRSQKFAPSKRRYRQHPPSPKYTKAPNVVYTVAERIEMVRQHEQGLSYRCIVDHFAAAYPDRPIPSKTTVASIVKRFAETGNLNPNLSRVSQRGRRLMGEINRNIYSPDKPEDLEESNSAIDQEDDDSKSAIQGVLEAQNYGPFGSQYSEEPSFSDTKNQIKTFTKNVVVDLHADPDILDRICFCDECTVELSGTEGENNNRVWSETQPHLLIESGTHLLIESGVQHHQLTVWVGVIEDRLVGPFFIDGELNGQKYLHMYKEFIVPALRSIEGNDPIIWFQQDAAPSHFTNAVTAYLDLEFPGRWIGRGGPGLRPARSFDLTLLDYPLWCYLKNRLHVEGRIENLDMLRERVTKAIEDMDPCIISDMKV